MASPTEIQHQPEQQRFVIELDGKECLLEYQRQGSAVDFTHTYVPFALRGRGLADELVVHGLAWARAEQLEISASCWFVAKAL